MGEVSVETSTVASIGILITGHSAGISVSGSGMGPSSETDRSSSCRDTSRPCMSFRLSGSPMLTVRCSYGSRIPTVHRPPSGSTRMVRATLARRVNTTPTCRVLNSFVQPMDTERPGSSDAQMAFLWLRLCRRNGEPHSHREVIALRDGNRVNRDSEDRGGHPARPDEPRHP
jgi:hypothetical protein